jgi:hypothetical protein
MLYNCGISIYDSIPEAILLATLGVLRDKGDFGPYSISTLRRAYEKVILGGYTKRSNITKKSFNNFLEHSIHTGFLQVTRDLRGKIKVTVLKDWESDYPSTVHDPIAHNPIAKDLLGFLGRSPSDLKPMTEEKLTILGKYKKGVLAKLEVSIRLPRLRGTRGYGYPTYMPPASAKATDFCTRSMTRYPSQYLDSLGKDSNLSLDSLGKDSNQYLDSLGKAPSRFELESQGLRKTDIPFSGLVYRDADCLITFRRVGVPTHRLPRLYPGNRLVKPSIPGLHKEDYIENLSLELYKRRWSPSVIHLLPQKRKYSEAQRKWVEEYNEEQKKGRVQVAVGQYRVGTLKFKTLSDLSSFNDFGSLDPLFRSPVKNVQSIVVKRIEELPNLRRELRDKLSKGKRKVLYKRWNTSLYGLEIPSTSSSQEPVWISNEVLEDPDLKVVKDTEEEVI